MSERLSFEEILDLCIQDVVAGVATVDQCLARHPEHRARLEPALRTAFDLSALPRPAERRPDPARREAFMDLIREAPQQEPRRLRGGLRRPALPRMRAPSFRAWGAGAFAMRALPAGALALLAVFLVFGRGATPAAAATLTVFAGQVEQQVDGAWQPLADGASVHEGLAIRTLSGAHALLTFPDGSTASLGQGTQVSLARIEVDGQRRIEIEQAGGRLWNDVVPVQGDDSYRVRTPHATVDAHGTVFETVVDTDTSVSTVDGLVRVTSAGGIVDVLTGQVVRATAEEIASPEAIPLVGEITVRAPMAAALTSTDGAATGLLPSGVVFRQVPGVTTTGPGERQQHMFVGNITPGVYTLWLRRYADGDGIVVIETQADRLNVPVPANVRTARVLIAIDIVDGGVFMRALDTEIETVPEAEAPAVRVVQSQRTRAAVELAARVQSAETATATEAPTETRTPAAATPAATEAPTGTATRPSGAATATADIPWPLALRVALDTAARTQDNTVLAQVLERVLDGDDQQDRERLDALAEAIQDPADRVRVVAVLAMNVSPDVRDELGAAIEEMLGTRAGTALRDGLTELWLGLEQAPAPDPTSTATEEATQAPVATVTATPTAEPTSDDRGEDRGGDDDEDRRRGFLNELLERWRERIREGNRGQSESTDSNLRATETDRETVTATATPEPSPTASPSATVEATRTPTLEWWRR